VDIMIQNEYVHCTCTCTK